MEIINQTKTLAEQAETLIATINDPVKGKALAARLVCLLSAPGWGYQHGSIMNLGNALVAASLISDAVESKAPLNDGTMEDLMALDLLLRTGPEELMMVDVYDGANVSTRIKGDEYETGKLYVFSKEFISVVDRICSVGNSGRPRWMEAAHVKFEGDETSIFLPREVVRGVDPQSQTTITAEEAFKQLNVINGDKLLDKINEVLDRDRKEQEEREARTPSIQIQKIAHALTQTHTEFTEQEANHVYNQRGSVQVDLIDQGLEKFRLRRSLAKDELSLVVFHDELPGLLLTGVGGILTNINLMKDHLTNTVHSALAYSIHKLDTISEKVDAQFCFDPKSTGSDNYYMTFVVSREGIETRKPEVIFSCYCRLLEALFQVVIDTRALSTTVQAEPTVLAEAVLESQPAQEVDVDECE